VKQQEGVKFIMNVSDGLLYTRFSKKAQTYQLKFEHREVRTSSRHIKREEKDLQEKLWLAR
jgi:hypothetical protein